MKITKRQLRRIIKEEKVRLAEQDSTMAPWSPEALADKISDAAGDIWLDHLETARDHMVLSEIQDMMEQDIDVMMALVADEFKLRLEMAVQEQMEEQDQTYQATVRR